MRLLLFVLSIFLLASCSKSTPKVLIFTKTAGYHHESIDDGIQAIQMLGRKHGFQTVVSDQSEHFEEDIIKEYKAIIFLSTTGNILNKSQESVFERFIQSGGGFVGIHAATDTEYDWPWYNQLVGAYFANHPEIQEATLEVLSKDHLSTKEINEPWKHTDEWYNFKSFNQDVHRLVNLDESSYQGGEMGADHPISWYHEFDGGRAWYTGLGHTNECYQNDVFLKHVLGGILYAMGDQALDYSKAHTSLIPPANRFGLNRLIQGVLVEPTEMTILPNEDVLIAQRRGELIKYISDSKQTKVMGSLDVYHSSEVPDVNVEEGLMGLTKDPSFDQNGFIYMFYSPVDKPVNRLSRFYIDNDSLHRSSETIILEVNSDRDVCCHTGGSIAFSGDGQYLYLSTGDNATPFDEKGSTYVNNGFAPQDNRAGHEQYDARRSSGNTNDLRGKILRISLNADGSYSIPAGNLFPEDMEKTRPEIYVMGTRNPYRISIDQKTGDLFWGDVGPDAGSSDKNRGPMGHDEINRASKAGNFGWPLFVADNKAYNQYDYTSGESSSKYDPTHPINLSKNNTGLTDLPPANPALIYYPYDKSKEFPSLASGGRNAMAGPVYYVDEYPKNTAYPSHFNGKLFIYDWIRQWIKLVDIDETGSIVQIEDFLPEEDFANIIDMELGPKGQIYILEYGKGWFSKNPDASLTRIDYNSGNRAPIINSLTSSKNAGQIPLNVTLDIKASDPEDDALTYSWFLNGSKIEEDGSTVQLEIKEIDQSIIYCKVSDAKGNSTQSADIVINSGNERANIDIEIIGNQRFFFQGEKIFYKVNIEDDQAFNKEQLMIKHEIAASNSNIGHLNNAAKNLGELLIESSDCASCHKKIEASIGPSYKAIAERYQSVSYAMAYLAEKIRKGGSGNWGEGAMAAHPTISEAESLQIADWILAFNDDINTEQSLEMEGFITPSIDPNEAWKNTSYLRVSYSDAPSNGSKPLTATKEFKWRPNFYRIAHLKRSENMALDETKGTKSIVIPKAASNLYFDNIDLTDIKSLQLAFITEMTSNAQLDMDLINEQNEIIAKHAITGPFNGKRTIELAIPNRLFEPGNYSLRFTNQSRDNGTIHLVKLAFNK